MNNSRKKLSATVAVACCAGVAGVALAAVDLPFWKEGTSEPSRVPSSQAESAASVPLDSRTVHSAESPAVAFDSSASSGLTVICR